MPGAAKRPLDIAIYAFTDRTLAALRAREAEQGTVMRIYRDGEQYENEERNAARFRDQSTTATFRGQRNIHVRVKPPSPSDLMHLKVWSDTGKYCAKAARTGRRWILRIRTIKPTIRPEPD